MLTFLLVLFLLQMAGSFDPSFCKSLTLRCFTDVNTWLPIIYHESAWLHDNFTVHHFAKRNLGPPMQMRHARGFSGKWLLKDDSHPSLAANVLDFFGSGRTSRLPWSEEATCWVHQSHVIPGTFLASSLWGSWEDFTLFFFNFAIGLIVESPLIPLAMFEDQSCQTIMDDPDRDHQSSKLHNTKIDQQNRKTLHGLNFPAFD